MGPVEVTDITDPMMPLTVLFIHLRFNGKT